VDLAAAVERRQVVAQPDLPVKTPLMQVELIRSRVITIIREKHSPVLVDDIPHLYSKHFHGNVLHWESLGFSTLRRFLESFGQLEWSDANESSVRVAIDSNYQPPTSPQCSTTAPSSITNEELDGESAALDNDSNSTHKTEQPENKVPVGIRSLVLSLVEMYAPIDLCLFPALYQEANGKPLNFKSLGFSKLKSFLESLPELQVSDSEKGGQSYCNYNGSY